MGCVGARPRKSSRKAKRRSRKKTRRRTRRSDAHRLPNGFCHSIKARIAVVLSGCGSKPMGSHLGVGAPLILVYFSGDWDVPWGYGLLTHGHLVVHLMVFVWHADVCFVIGKGHS